MKQEPGKDMQVVGGATLVSSLMNLGLIDELQLMVNPLIQTRVPWRSAIRSPPAARAS